MPINYKDYPSNWKTEIRPKILERADNKCEECGAKNYHKHPITGSCVILTISHTDHNIKNNKESNLRALCQRCHNQHDVEYRKLNRIQREIKTKEDAGQGRLF